MLRRRCLAAVLAGTVVNVFGQDVLTPRGRPEPLPEDEAFRIDALVRDRRSLLVRVQMPPQYYLYRDKTRFRLLAPAGAVLRTPRWPAAVEHYDEHFGTVWVYFDRVEVSLPVRQLGRAERLELEIEFQGCLQDVLCYPLMRRRLLLDLPRP